MLDKSVAGPAEGRPRPGTRPEPDAR